IALCPRKRQESRPAPARARHQAQRHQRRAASARRARIPRETPGQGRHGFRRPEREIRPNDREMSYAFAKVRPIALGLVRWTEGFWADRFRVCRETMVPAMGRLMTDTERVKFLGNFEVASGPTDGRHRGPRWNDGDFYKWLEA